MIYDFLMSDKTEDEPLYRRLYLGIRTAVEKGMLKKGERLPSIRKICEDLGVSKTTVETAYHQLCAEGYIRSIPQSGFAVEAEFDSVPRGYTQTVKNTRGKSCVVFDYDFGSKSVDSGNFNQWRKYVKDILNKPYLLTSYGEPRGEEALRRALQRYSFGIRGVNSDEDSIIIGAGTQALLYLLSGPLRTGTTVALEKGSYPHAEQLFRDFGFNLIYAPCDKYGIIPEELFKTKADTVLVNPNCAVNSGLAMPVQRRIDFIHWAESVGGIIIEDDFNGELRYTGRPVPAIQSFNSENVAYLGSFSKLLLPSVRIGYMVIPQRLKHRFDRVNDRYNQTASKLEQLALAAYISDGKLESNLRRLRKIYAEKSRLVISSVKKYFSERTPYILNESSLCVAVKISEQPPEEVFSLLRKNKINTIKSIYGDYNLTLGLSGIHLEQIAEGVEKIHSLLCKSD